MAVSDPYSEARKQQMPVTTRQKLLVDTGASALRQLQQGLVPVERGRIRYHQREEQTFNSQNAELPAIPGYRSYFLGITAFGKISRGVRLSKTSILCHKSIRMSLGTLADDMEAAAEGGGIYLIIPT